MPYVSGNEPLVEIARHLAQLSLVAYGEEAEIRSTISSDYPQVAFLANRAGFVASNPEVIVIVFTGTQDLFDVLINLNTELVTGFGGRVHQGFGRLTEQLWPEIAEGLHQLRSNSQKVWLTGHSLGGAMTILTGSRLADEGITPSQIHTFGAPKVGDRDFASSYSGNLLRFENSGDSVPRLPPFENFKSVGVQGFLTTTNQLYIPDGSWQDKLVTGIELFGQGLNIFQRVKEGQQVTKVLWDEMVTRYHSLYRYLEKLAAL